MERVTSELRDDVALLTWDDGKANTFSRASIADVNAALDRAADAGAKAIVLCGRPGYFSAGFDLKELGRGGPDANDLLRAGAGLLVRVYGSPIPVVAACTGHALGMGALLLLSSDVRIGADAPCKIALNESRISMHLPTFAVELAEAGLSKRHLTRSAILAQIHAPASAAEAGYLDRVEAPGALLDAALAEARDIASFAGKHVARTKLALRRARIERIQASIEAEFPVR